MKPLDLQRKPPQQSRSKSMVDAIFEATVRILPKTGSRNITTRKIAEIAGVSIGSLYQYFPNKESVLASLIDMSMNAIDRETQRLIDSMEKMNLDDGIDYLVDFAVEKLLKDRAKIREIFMQAPELGKLPGLFHQRQMVVVRLAEILAKHKPGYSREKYVRVTYTAVNGVVGVIHTTLYDQTQTYTDAELAAEMKSLAKAYIERELI